MIKRPVMRFPGGKFSIAKWVISHFPEHLCYVELFGGAASVLLQKPRANSEIYNDINSDVVNVFRVLRDEKKALELERKIYLTPFSREEYDLAYDRCADQVEMARRIIFRSFYGWGSDAVNRKTGGRSFKNPSMILCSREWSTYHKHIKDFVVRFKDVYVENKDYKFIISTYDNPKTLFYVDPPYLQSTRKFRGSVRYKHEFDKDYQHIDLAETLKNVKGMVVVSGYDSKLYHELYSDSGWRCVRRNSQVMNGSKRIECLWLSPNIKNNSLF